MRGVYYINFSSTSVHTFYKKCTISLTVLYCSVKTKEAAIQRCSCKKAVLKIFQKFITKTAVVESFFMKMQAFKLATLWD